MGRIRLAVAFLGALGMLLGFSREAGAQTSGRLAKSSAEKADPSFVTRVPLPHPKPRGPEIFYCETADTSCRTSQDFFPIADLRDLYVYVVWPGVSGQHVQTVQFFLPEGSVYSSQKTKFVVGGGRFSTAVAPVNPNVVAPTPPASHLMADGNKVHAEGIHSLLMKSRGDSTVLTVLPVAGTYITQRNLSGVWRVRVLLDDKLALESEFNLVPSQPVNATKLEEEAEK